ncbi:MAG: hypothetical protein AVDCRST_MAG16-1149 [uncultured Frankineae bacterium]|uniref:Uncharacterized protein n=1 Tax=uncultured Frankineae bacterium TaxID=437475 RepID=A0A6J4LBV0_9ACTN|nr:MAG: hypothetical protein AVDCRST_MAG16-1149 [uncultured Frankineae bacterium]
MADRRDLRPPTGATRTRGLLTRLPEAGAQADRGQAVTGGLDTHSL